RADVASSRPLRNPGPDVLGYSQLRQLDIVPLVARRKQLGQLLAGLAPCALERLIVDDPLARGVIAALELQLPRRLAPTANVAGHFWPLIIYFSPTLCFALRTSALPVRSTSCVLFRALSFFMI